MIRLFAVLILYGFALITLFTSSYTTMNEDNIHQQIGNIFSSNDRTISTANNGFILNTNDDDTIVSSDKRIVFGAIDRII